MNFSDVLNALNQASSFELFRMRAAISVALDEPARQQAIQANLRVGQQVDYFDERANAQRSGTLLELRRKTAVIRDRDDGRRWLIDYASINLDGVAVHIRQPAPRGLHRNELAVGDRVGYLDRDGQQRSGTVLRLNDKTASLQVADQQWRVAYSLLHHVMDGNLVEAAGTLEIGDGGPRSAGDAR